MQIIYKWSDADLDSVGKTLQDVYTVKQFQLHCKTQRPPQRLLLQAKLCGNDQYSGTKLKLKVPNGEHSFLSVDFGNEILLDLLSSSERPEISLPIYFGNDTVATPTTFVINAIDCHIGDRLKSGHYAAIRFEDDGEQHFCDDDRVTKLEDACAV
ncbi:hypothetical protein SOPP22_03140 [Shewanella sp. OPT22]|nr:hypothetical protein SOPP22_03140 [Shewanella sp. OPT22]